MYIFTTVPTPNVSVTIPNNQTVGRELSVRCDVATVIGVTKSIDIVWMKNGTAIEVTDDNRINVSSTTFSNNIHSSILKFLYLSEDDENIYSCNATIHNSSNSKSFELKKFYCKL